MAPIEPTPIEQFTRAWRRMSSVQPNPLSQDIFPDGATLLVGLAAGASPQCHVVWLDGRRTSWCISDLTFQNGVLRGEVTPRRSVDDTSQYNVTLWLDPENHLHGELKVLTQRHGGGSGPVGTFIAEADDPREEGADTARLTESPAM